MIVLASFSRAFDAHVAGTVYRRWPRAACENSIMLRPCLVLLSLAAPANAQLHDRQLFGSAMTDAIKNAIVSEIPAYFQCNKNLIATANATGV